MKQLHLGLMVAATIALGFALFVFCAYAYNLITFPFDYDQGEGFELVDTILFSQFTSPYQNTDSYPYYSSNYPPFYHIIAAPFVWVFGEAYWYGRLLSFLSTLIAASAIYYAVYRDSRHRWIAVLSALAFVSSNTIYHIGPLFRQHIMMVMFETLAVVILVVAYPKKHRTGIFWGLFLLLVAGYTKQLAAITALAVIAWMILRNPRRGLVWSVGFSTVGIVIFAWMILITNGEWWRQAILANVNEFFPFQMFGLIKLWLRLHLLLIIPALLMTAYEIYLNRLSLYSVWFVFGTVFGAFGSGTWGAGDSYFATSIAAMCILSGIFFSRILQGTWSLNVNNFYSRLVAALLPIKQQIIQSALVLIPILYVGYAIMTFKMPSEGLIFGTVATVLEIEPNVMGRHYDSANYVTSGYANIGHFVTSEDIQNGRYIVGLIQSTDAPVLSEEAGFSLVAGRDVITNPTQLRNLWLNNLWNGDELIADIESQTFGMIIIRASFYPNPVLEAIEHYYQVDEVVAMNGFEYLIWRPQE